MLGSYDIISRASDPDDVPTDGEGADEDRIERSLLVNAPGGVQAAPVVDLRRATREDIFECAPSAAGATRDTRCAPLTLEMLAGDAARDAATMLERAMHDARTQTQRLRARERKLGIPGAGGLRLRGPRPRSGAGTGTGEGTGAGAPESSNLEGEDERERGRA